MQPNRPNPTASQQVPQFSPIRAALWPVHSFELGQFLPMFLMFFFVSFNYSLLRISKDTLVMNAPGSGAEIIPFLKLWFTLPAAVLVMLLYVKMAASLRREQLFYATLAPFLAFFVLFPYVLLPMTDYLHPTTTADALARWLPAGMSGLVAVYRNWTYALFYVLAELWGSVVLSTLYWGFANEITPIHQAKRFYGLLGIGANFALLFVSPAASWSRSLGDWNASLTFIMQLVTVATLAIAALYWYINRQASTQQTLAASKATGAQSPRKSKVKLGFWASLQELLKSPYLACLCLLVLCYGISINLVEVLWKHTVRLHFAADSQAMFGFQANLMSATGITTMVLMLFGTSNVLRLGGWQVAALLTPLIMLITSFCFFLPLTWDQLLMGFVAYLGTTPLAISVWIGGIQNVLSKGTKYSFFDPTKEMAYIPLPEQVRRVGKAAIDGVGARLGKSGGAAINMVLIALLGNIEAIVPFAAVLVMAIIVVWIIAVFALGKRFSELTEQQKLQQEHIHSASISTTQQQSTSMQTEPQQVV